MAKGDSVLEVQGLWKRFGAAVALRDIDLTIREGDFLTLLGPSGSGKTTLLMAMAGFVTPSEGSILMHGRDLVPLAPEDRNLGVVFQGYALFPHMTVAQNVGFPLVLRGWKGSRLRDQVMKTLELVELSELALRKPAQLSGGQQQRVALARCLVFEPEIVLLDEPLSALDRQLRIKLQDELKALHRQVGVTFVNVTHDQDEALSMSTHVAVIDKGRIVQYGSPREIYGAPETKFVARFIGRSNLMRADSIESASGNMTAVIGHSRIPVAGEIEVSGSAHLSLRPETVSVTSALSGVPLPYRAEVQGDEVAMPGTVLDLTYQGSLTMLLCDTPLGRLRSETPTERLDPKISEGSNVRLAWRRGDVRLLQEDAPA